MASVPRQASLMQDLGWDASAQAQGHSRQNAPSRHQEAAPQIQSVGRELQAGAGGAGRARASREESDGYFYKHISLSRFRTVNTWDSCDGSEKAPPLF